MSVLNKLASFQNIKSDVPNQELAKELANKEDVKSIKEIAENLWNKDKNIQSDCIKVLYEIGYLNPKLIGDYVGDFLKLLKSKNNRLVWGAMIALSTIAKIKSKEIFENLDEIISSIEKGSVITVDGGIKTLSGVASANEKYRNKIFPYLMKHLKNCRPKEVAMHSEFISEAVDSKNKKEFIEVLKQRYDILTSTQKKRIDKILKKLEDTK